MTPAPLPADEEDRLAALRSYEILDTACEDAFDDMTRLAARVSGMPVAMVSLIDRDRAWFKARHGLDVPQAPRELAFCAHAILTPDAPLVVSDARADPRFADNPLVAEQPGFRFYAGIPLRNPEGFALGTLCVLDHRPRQMDAEVINSLGGIARAVGTTLELRRTMRQVRDMALADPLTGLANRRALLTALEREIARQGREGGVFSLFYLDLDGFKGVNDGFGHEVGDRLLRVAADALRLTTRGSDVPARLGGDEFAVLLSGGDGAETPVAAERIRRALRRAFAAEGWAVSASIGAVCFLGRPGGASEALRQADAQMYRAKAAGGDRVAALEFRPSAPVAA